MLTGACLSRAGLNRKTGLATLTLVLAAEAPDLDIITLVGGSVSNLQHHRGFTHTLLGVPFVAGGTLAIVYGIYRILLLRGRTPKLPPNWRLLYVYGLLGALSHIFLDFTNNYGVRPFAPFNPKWYSWDIVFILDPIILGVLLLAVFTPTLFGLISEEIGARKSPRGRSAAIFALVCWAALIYVRDFEHRRAVNLLESVTYADEEPRQASAYPTPLNPFIWNGVVETRDFFESMVVNPHTGQIDPNGTAVVRHKPEETPVTLAAKRSRLGQIYLGWAKYPIVEADRRQDNSGYIVQFIDLRFARITTDRRPPPLAAYVILDPNLKVTDMQVGGPRPSD